MNKFALVCLILCAVLVLSGCAWSRLDGEKMQERLDGFAAMLGSLEITEDEDLIGQRSGGRDDYAGGYSADCTGQNGRDVVFGGGSIQESTLRCYGMIAAESGSATVRIRLNEEVVILEPDEKGCFDIVSHRSALSWGHDGMDGNVFCSRPVLMCRFVHQPCNIRHLAKTKPFTLCPDIYFCSGSNPFPCSLDCVFLLSRNTWSWSGSVIIEQSRRPL